MDSNAFKTIAGAAVLIGGIALAYWEAAQKTRKKRSEFDRPVIITSAAKPQPAKSAPTKPTKPANVGPSPETVAAMHKQADAERAIAEALEHKAKYITDPIKRARIEKQAANSWHRFNAILDKIDKLTALD